MYMCVCVHGVHVCGYMVYTCMSTWCTCVPGGTCVGVHGVHMYGCMVCMCVGTCVWLHGVRLMTAWCTCVCPLNCGEIFDYIILFCIV